MRDDLKPLSWPIPPDIQGMNDTSARETVKEYLDGIEFVVKENERRSKRALRRMKLCTWVRLTVSVGNPESIKHHYSWCPHDYWFN